MSDLAKQLNGPWFNQLGSCLDLNADEDGGLTGTFRSFVGGVDGGHPVSGFFSSDPGGSGAAVAFTVSWPSVHSVTVWSGHYRAADDVIVTTWLLSEASSEHGEWRSTSLGHDEFRRSPTDHRTAPSVASRAPHVEGAWHVGGDQ
jgi:Avidin family